MSIKNFGACLKYPWHQHLCMKVPSCDCKASRALFPVLLTIETTCCLDFSLICWPSKVLNPLKVGGKGIKHAAQMEATPLSLWKVFPLLYSVFLSFSSSWLVLALLQCLPHLSIPYFLNLFLFGCPGSLMLHGLSLVAVSRGYSILALHGLLIAVASPDAEHRL